MAMRLENYQLALRVPKNAPSLLARWHMLKAGRDRAFKTIHSLPGRVGELQYDSAIPYFPLFPAIMPPEMGESKRSTPEHPVFNLGRRPLSNVSLFSFTSKMGCASFSLAAGPVGDRGTCHAANLKKDGPNGFVALCDRAIKDGHFVDVEAAATGWRERGEEVKSVSLRDILGMFICDACYAGKGQYMYDSMAVYFAAKKVWTERLLREGRFVSEMVRAIRHIQSNDKLMLGKLTSSDYFRIHDSGDFYNINIPGLSPHAYFDAWVEVILALPDIQFWAPTRMWVFEDWRNHFRATFARHGANLSRFSLRPSALFYGSRAPMIRGMPMGSTSAPKPFAPFTDPATGMNVTTWECPAYKSVEGSCAGACCRTCWDRPDVPVSYHTH